MASKPTSGNGGMASDTKTGATAGLGDTQPKVFDDQGAIGKQFTGEPLSPATSASPSCCKSHSNAEPEQGALGGTAQSIGGPLDKEGAIGKQFTSEGAIGGSVQKALGGEKGGSY